MKTNNVTILIFLLMTGCEGSKFSSLTNGAESNQSTLVVSPQADQSQDQELTPTMGVQKYLYALVSGVVYVRPINPDTGNIMAPSAGGWTFRPPQSQDFYLIMGNSTNLYAFQRTSIDTYLIFQYKFVDTDIFTDAYNSQRPWSALSPATVNTGVLRYMATFGTDGNLYMQNGTISGYPQVDRFTANGDGALTRTATIPLPLGMTFSHSISATDGVHTYTGDHSSIIHSVNGVEQQSYSFTAPYTQEVTDLVIH